MLPSTLLFQHTQRSGLGNLFKSAMASVGAQAMILTAGSSHASAELHGMTLSSVSSLSVNPEPLLSFNLHLPSYTSKTLHENHGWLGLHVMPPTKTSLILGRKFSGGAKREPSSRDSESANGDLFHEMTTPFDGLQDAYFMHKVKGEISVPVLKESEFVFLCSNHKVFSVSNHEIWVVKVNDILFPNKTLGSNSTGGLLYYSRGFHKLGQQLSES